MKVPLSGRAASSVAAALLVVGISAWVALAFDDDAEVVGASPTACTDQAVGTLTIPTNIPLSPTAELALATDLPEYLPLADPSKFYSVGGGQASGASSMSESSGDPDVVMFELRDASGELLARADVKRFGLNGWALTGYDACAYLTGAPPTPSPVGTVPNS